MKNLQIKLMREIAPIIATKMQLESYESHQIYSAFEDVLDLLSAGKDPEELNEVFEEVGNNFGSSGFIVMKGSVGSVISADAKAFIAVLLEQQVPPHYFARALVELWQANIDLSEVGNQFSRTKFSKGYVGNPPSEVMSAICALLKINEEGDDEKIATASKSSAKILSMTARVKDSANKEFI